MRLLFICLLPAACLATNTIRLPIRRSSPSTPLDHRHLKRSAPPRNGAAQLYNDEGSEYLVRVSIGTPPQNFTVALDTGR